MFQYAWPPAMAAANAGSAAASVAPWAVTEAGLKLEAEVRSNVFEYVPLVTPSGKPAKLGVVVATPAVPLKGEVVAACKWEAVVFPVRPLKDTCSCSVWATSSYVTVPLPIPSDAVGSLGPSSDTTY